MTTRTGSRSGYRCQECGWAVTKWVGRCSHCRAWGTLTEVLRPVRVGSPGSLGHSDGGALDADPGGWAAGTRTAPRLDLMVSPTAITGVDAAPAGARSTGCGEIDRVLGGGMVPGSVILMAGEPGVGKSTLLLELAARTARAGARVLYATAEESAAQIRGRAERIGALAAGLHVVAETDLASVLGHIHRGLDGQDSVTPFDLVLVDSVQTVTSAQLDGAPGSVTQVREVASCLIQAARAQGSSTVLVGHVTKDGAIAGPRALEHLVDVVLQFEGERHGRLRMLRAVKNRFGPTDEVGCFEMTGTGVTELADPSALFRSGVDRRIPGTALTVTLNGRRPMICEIQALVTRGGQATGSGGRRTTSGVEAARVALLLAVLHRHVAVRVLDQDCYVSTVGGARALEPAADLAIIMAVAGSAADLVLPPDTLVVGEVGLAGEIRPVPGLGRRLSEAARLGMRTAVIPAQTLDEPPPPGLVTHEVGDVTDAVLLMIAAQTRRLEVT